MKNSVLFKHASHLDVLPRGVAKNCLFGMANPTSTKFYARYTGLIEDALT
jgi:hypothetical protein